MLKTIAFFIFITSNLSHGYMPTEQERLDFYEAWQRGDYESMTMKLNSGYNPNDVAYGSKSKDSYITLITLRAGREHNEIDKLSHTLQIFLKEGADVEMTSQDGDFPVYLVENYQIASILEEYGADFTRIYHDTVFNFSEVPEFYINNPKVLEIAFKQGVVPTCRIAESVWYDGSRSEKLERRAIYNKWFVINFGKTKEELCDNDDDWDI